MSIKHKRKSLFLVLFLLLLIVGCNKTSEFESIIIDSDTISDYYEVGSLTLEDIKFKVTLTSGEELIISGSDFSLSDLDLAKLKIPGTHKITLVYKNELTYVLELTLISSEEYNTFLSIYKMGLAAGSIDISYEEWLNSIRGEDGIDGKKILLQVSNQHIQYQYEGDDSWNDLISLSDLTGKDGKEVTFSIQDNAIQWQYIGDTSWKSLISLDDLMGDDGSNGREVTMQVNRTHIQWKYLEETTWHNLIELDSLTGVDGIGVSQLEINDFGELVVTYTNQESFNLGKINVYHTVKFVGLDGYLIDFIHVLPNQEITYPTSPIENGYQFIRWDEDIIEIASDLTIHAIYQKNTYAITFDPQGGSNVDPLMNIEHGSTVNLEIPLKEGYVFKGWFTGLTVNDSQFTNTSLVTTNLTLYAKFELGIYTVKFVDIENHVFDEIAVSYGESVTPPSAPSVIGYKFNHWSESLNDITQNLIVKPIYDVNSYHINYEIVTSDYSDDIDIQLVPGETILDIFSGDNHSSIFTSKGRILMWGKNDSGQLGDGTTTNKLIPTDISSQFDLNDEEFIVKAFFGQYHGSAITSLNRIFMWGNNYHGQLGDGTTTNQLIPIDITSQFTLNPDEIITEMFLGNDVSSAITSLGRIFIWGYNAYYQIGDGTITTRRTPLDVTNQFNLSEGERVTYIAFSLSHSLAYTSLGRVFTWGNNQFGQLGDGTTISKPTPTEMDLDLILHDQETIQNIYVGIASYNAILTSENRVLMWGNNNDGELGDGTTTNQSIPVDITNHFHLDLGETITHLGIGKFHNTAYTSNHRIFSWGYDFTIHLGEYTSSTIVIPRDDSDYFELNDNETMIKMTQGEAHTFFFTSDQRLILWGDNHFGQLGDGTITQKTTPFELRSYTHLMPHVETYNYNTDINPYLLSRDGYQFNGWYSDMSLNASSVLTTMPANDLYVYGSWIPNLYDISYVLNGGTHTGNPVTYTIESSNITLNQPTKTGYTFGGWYDHALFDGFPITTIFIGSIGDLTLYAKWSINSYTITFDSNEGSLVDPITQDYLTTVIEPVEPTRLNYTFDGWFTDEALTNPYAFTTMPAQNITLYAKWLSNDPDIEYTLSSSSISIDQYIGNTRNYELPSTIDSLPVTEIKALAFSNAMSLEILYIPLSVTTIGENAFQSSNPNLVILTPHLSQPIGWDVNFNPDKKMIIYGYSEPESIDSLSSKTSGEEVYIQGIYTGYTTSTKYFIQDDAGGIFIYISSTTLKDLFMNLEPGVEVYIKGIYNQSPTYTYITIDSLDDFAIIDETPNLPEIADLSSLSLTSEVLSNYDGQLVSLLGYELKASITVTSSQPFSFVLTNDTYDITVYVNSFILDYALLADQLNGTYVGSIIDISKGVLSRVNDKYQIELFGDDILITNSGK